jgi:4-azaleucine resistance transporter AzlC
MSWKQKRPESWRRVFLGDGRPEDMLVAEVGKLYPQGMLRSLRKQEFIRGVRDTLPLLLGAFPFGLIYGAVAATAGLSTPAAMAMSAFVFAGSSQFIAVGLVAAQTPVVIIVLTTLIVNLRHMLYSATLVPYLKHLPQTWRIALAFWLTDETFAVTVHRFQQGEVSAQKHWYQLGSSIAMYVNWQFWCLSGLMLGKRIPDASDWGLDVAMPITFIGMIIPFVKTLPVAVCLLTAGTASLLTLTLPYKLGIVVSAFAGITAGLASERTMKKAKGAPAP